MIGVVIPVHNEEDYLHACLSSVRIASEHPDLMGEAVCVVAVLDACTDNSGAIAGDLSVDIVRIEAGNVGAARAAGAAYLLQTGARWLAFTDADSVVSQSWLSVQLSLGADAVCGTVFVDDWSPHGERMHTLRRRFLAGYRDHDGHRHIHGANFGVSAAAYRQAGGFTALACGEDVALVQALLRCGARISWSAAPRVATSSRLATRARDGFGDTLRALSLAP